MAFISKIDSLLGIVDELTYINYRHNRNLSPHITPERWEKSYGPQAKAMEERYQQEIDYFANPVNRMAYENRAK